MGASTQFQRIINGLHHRSGARPEILLLYTHGEGYALIGCNRSASLLFGLPEVSPDQSPIQWPDIPHQLARYLAESLSKLSGEAEENLPPLRLNSETKSPRRFGARLFASMEKPEDGQTTGRQFYLICFDEAVDWSESHDREFETRKMEMIGQLASGVAHDFNNLIMGIQSNAEALLNDNPPDRHTRRAIDNILRACNTGSSLTRSLLGYAKRQPLLMTEFNLVEMVNDVRAIARLSLAVDHPIACDDFLSEAAEPLKVHGCYSSLSHCLLNLIKNAREAMEAGGRVMITWGGDDETARLTVTDQGKGIPEEQLAHIFEPFFSTKSKGTGLGLAMVKGILSQHGGTIEISSEVGAGTSVALVWPRWRSDTKKVPTAHLAERKSASGQVGKKMVIEPHDTLAYVIDDDELVRGGVEGLLEHLGYRVMTFGDAESAVEALREKETPQVVLVDYHMPGMDGSEFIHHWFDVFLPTHPKADRAKVLLVSGHPPSKFQDIAEKYAGMDVGFLQKPFSLETLAAALQQDATARAITMRITKLGNSPSNRWSGPIKAATKKRAAR